MKTFRDPGLVLSFGMLQLRIGDPYMVKAKRQAPTFDVSAQLGPVVGWNYRVGKVSHE